MADAKGHPIHPDGELAAPQRSRPPEKPEPVDPYPKCVACGQWHGGGGNSELRCLRETVVKQRHTIQLLRALLGQEQ